MTSLPVVEDPVVPPAVTTVTLSTTPLVHNRNLDLNHGLHLKPTPPSCPHPSRSKDGSASGKREAPGPMVTTSDEEEPPTPPESPREATLSPASHDHDYESVGSPGGSSTASGPIYVRTSGFTQHAHSVTVSRPKIKKKKSSSQLLHVADNPTKTVDAPTNLQARANKHRKDPVPMRMRALPQSFWQQPNVAHNVSPAQNYPVLPPLVLNKDEEEVTSTEDLRPISPLNTDTTAEKDKTIKLEKPNKGNRVTERKVTIANTDLLFKLFDTVEKDVKTTKLQAANTSGSSSGVVQSSTPQIRRGRPRKMVPVTSKTFVSGEDPYMVECVTEKLFPQLNIEHGKATLNNGTTTLQVVTVKEGDRSVCLPSLSVEQNYSQMLSELVMHI